jgi:hypothetical protein
MSACFHVQGVQCDNCRTGLDTSPAPWHTPANVFYGAFAIPASKDDVEELRDEIRSLKELIRLYIEQSGK